MEILSWRIDFRYFYEKNKQHRRTLLCADSFTFALQYKNL